MVPGEKGEEGGGSYIPTHLHNTEACLHSYNTHSCNTHATTQRTCQTHTAQIPGYHGRGSCTTAATLHFSSLLFSDPPLTVKRIAHDGANDLEHGGDAGTAGDHPNMFLLYRLAPEFEGPAADVLRHAPWAGDLKVVTHFERVHVPSGERAMGRWRRTGGVEGGVERGGGQGRMGGACETEEKGRKLQRCQAQLPDPTHVPMFPRRGTVRIGGGGGGGRASPHDIQTQHNTNATPHTAFVDLLRHLSAVREPIHHPRAVHLHDKIQDAEVQVRGRRCVLALDLRLPRLRVGSSVPLPIYRGRG